MRQPPTPDTYSRPAVAGVIVMLMVSHGTMLVLGVAFGIWIGG